jgi:hypothetical protein
VISASSAVAFALLGTSAPTGLLVSGYRLRRREKRAWALHQLIDDHVEIRAADLLSSSDFTPETLDRAIRDLNNAAVGFLVWDRSAGLVQDGRLRSSRVLVDDCAGCGAKVSVNLSIGDLESARCPYCHDALGAERLMEEKAHLIDTLDTDPEVRSARNRVRPKFSVGLFLLLTFVFWPMGIGYAFWKWRAASGG